MVGVRQSAKKTPLLPLYRLNNGWRGRSVSKPTAIALAPFGNFFEMSVFIARRNGSRCVPRRKPRGVRGVPRSARGAPAVLKVKQVARHSRQYGLALCSIRDNFVEERQSGVKIFGVFVSRMWPIAAPYQSLDTERIL